MSGGRKASAGFPAERLAAIRTVPELAAVLRELRRRDARQRSAPELSYRELATQAGWSHATLGEYFTGKTLPPTDRFDVLIRLLGATGAELGLLATARDRVEEARRSDPAGPADPPARSAPGPPRQLPADVPGFTGRRAELAGLDGWLAADSAGPASVAAIYLVSGTAGVGKTALAVRWANQVRDRFGDGQLYVDLRGYGRRPPATAGDVLATLLTALGRGGRDIPVDEAARAAAYRTALHGRRMLILLDNAASVDQVRPLLPGAGGCLVLVTARDSLPGLVARDGARRLDLELLPVEDAQRLLGRLVGARVAAEPAAAAALAGYCARLPLALRLAAELAGARPERSLADLVGELADQRRRLDLLDAGGDTGTAVRAVFSWSYRQLPSDAARLFRLLGLHPGQDVDEHAAAALAGTDPAGAHRQLRTLARAYLVRPGGAGRYGMHDLLRAYAHDLTAGHDPAEHRDAAVTRLLDHYLTGAAEAMDRLYPADAHHRPRPSAPGGPPMPDPDAAAGWLDAERANLVASTGYAAEHGRPSHAIRLAATLARHLTSGGHHVDAVTVHTHELRAARALGDQAAQAHALTNLGIVHDVQGRYPTAAEHQQQALELFRQLGDRAGEARALGNLSVVYQLQGRYGPAAAHQEAALTLFQQLGDPIGQARALANLGSIDQLQGRYELAADRERQALELFCRLGDRTGEAHALTYLGAVCQRLGNPEEAVGHHRQALALFERLGDRAGRADTLTNLGDALRRRGELRAAADHLEQALAEFRDLGERTGEAAALNELGAVHRDAGQPEQALARHTDALRVATEIGCGYEQARAEHGIAEAHHAAGAAQRAEPHRQQARRRFRELGVAEAGPLQPSPGSADQAEPAAHGR